MAGGLERRGCRPRALGWLVAFVAAAGLTGCGRLGFDELPHSNPGADADPDPDPGLWADVDDDPLLLGRWTVSDRESLVPGQSPDRIVEWRSQVPGPSLVPMLGLEPPLDSGDQGVFFDGTAGMSLDLQLADEQDSTFVLLVRDDNPPADPREILGAETTEPDFPTWHRNIFALPGEACSDDRTDAHVRMVCTSERIDDGAWHVISLVMEDGTAKMWMDGVYGPEAAVWLSPGALRFSLGTTVSATNTWGGRIRDLLMWGRALEGQELDEVAALLEQTYP